MHVETVQSTKYKCPALGTASLSRHDNTFLQAIWILLVCTGQFILRDGIRGHDSSPTKETELVKWILLICLCSIKGEKVTSKPYIKGCYIHNLPWQTIFLNRMFHTELKASASEAHAGIMRCYTTGLWRSC